MCYSAFKQDFYLGEYPGVNDSWMQTISSQGPSVLSVDLSGSDVTDYGMTYLKDCTNLLTLNLNHCDQISDHGLEYINGTLSFCPSLQAVLLIYILCISHASGMSIICFWSAGPFVTLIYNLSGEKNNTSLINNIILYLHLTAAILLKYLLLFLDGRHTQFFWFLCFHIVPIFMWSFYGWRLCLLISVSPNIYVDCNWIL